MNIRKANILDMGWLASEGTKFLSWLYPDKPADVGLLYVRLKQIVNDGVLYIAEIDGKQIGAIGGLVTPSFWYGSEKDLTELFWWVQKKHRGSSAALRLLKKFIEYGKSDPFINNIVMTKEDISPISEEVYTKRGFKLRESNFVMEV